MIPRQHAMRNLIARITNTPWAIDPAKANAICDFLTLRRDGWELEPHEVAARIGAPRGPTAAVGGAGSQSVPSQIAVLSIQGTIVPRRVDAENVSGGGMVSAESLRQAIDSAAADPQVAQIVLDVNSPGGSVAGIPELAAAVAAASKRKPVWAVANLQMASAAYWISSQATTIVASPSAEVGSIGVLAIHSESSQADRTAGITTTVFRSTPGKADVNSVEPLTDEARTAFQTRIDQVHAQFLQAVADGRRVSLETVAQQFGQGRTMPAQAALAVGMVDRIATLDQLLAELTQPTGSAAPTGASVSGAAAASPAVPRLESVMDPRVLTALIRLGVCTAATSAEAAAVALQTVCALRQIDPTLDPAALAAALVPAATPPTVAAPAGSATPASAPALPVPPAGVGAAQLVSLVQMTAIPPAQQVRLLAELTPQANTLTLADLTARLNREATAATPPAGPHVAVVGDQVDNLITAGRDALLQRQFAGRNPSTIWDARAQGFVEWRPSRGAAALASLPRLAARILVAHGLPALTVDTLSTQAIARLIFGANPREFGIMADDSALYNSRGSFSNLLYDAANVVLRQAAVEAPTTYQNWMRRGQDLNDFRFVHKVVGGDMANPQAIPENGEFQEASFSDSRESYRLTVWGERFSVTWQTIVDDQLGAFTTVPQKQGRAMARNRNRVAYQTVKDNAALSDGTAFFASGHNNLAGTGAVISVASLNAGEKALREQKGVGDNAFVGVPPRYLLVPPAIAGTAREILSSTANPAASNSGVANIWQNGLEPIVDAELGAAATGGSDTSWYLFTDSADCEHFEYAYLAGMEQPVFEMQPSFERLGLAMRVYQPFACKGIDPAGVTKTPAGYLLVLSRVRVCCRDPARHVAPTHFHLFLGVTKMAKSQGTIEFTDNFNRAQEFSTTPGHNGWTIKDTSSSGTPTYLCATEDGGSAVLTLAATSEAEVVTLYQKDVLPIDLAKLKRFEVIAKVAGIDAVTTVCLGLASAQNDTSDSVAVNCWFKLAGADSTSAVVIETDDGVTDDDDNATGQTLAAVYKRFEIDFSNGLSDVRFYIDGQPVGAGTFSLAGVSAGQNVQPFFQLQKASGTGTPSLTIARVAYDEAYSYGS